MKSFFQLLKSDLHRAILSPSFALGALAALLVLYMGSIGMTGSTVPAATAFINSYGFNNMIDLFVLTSTFAYAAQFASEWQSGYYRPVVMRSSPTQYALSKCAATGISGGLSISLGALVYMIWLCLTRPQMIPERRMIDVSAMMFRETLKMGSITLYFLCFLYWIFLVGLFFSILGLTLSGWFPHKYVAYASPFVGSFVINRLLCSIRPLPPAWINPVQLAACRLLGYSTVTTLLIGTGMFLLYASICTFFFVRTVKRRIANG